MSLPDTRPPAVTPGVPPAYQPRPQSGALSFDPATATEEEQNDYILANVQYIAKDFGVTPLLVADQYGPAKAAFGARHGIGDDIWPHDGKLNSWITTSSQRGTAQNDFIYGTQTNDAQGRRSRARSLSGAALDAALAGGGKDKNSACLDGYRQWCDANRGTLLFDNRQADRYLRVWVEQFDQGWQIYEPGRKAAETAFTQVNWHGGYTPEAALPQAKGLTEPQFHIMLRELRRLGGGQAGGFLLTPNGAAAPQPAPVTSVPVPVPAPAATAGPAQPYSPQDQFRLLSLRSIRDKDAAPVDTDAVLRALAGRSDLTVSEDDARALQRASRPAADPAEVLEAATDWCARAAISRGVDPGRAHDEAPAQAQLLLTGQQAWRSHPAIAWELARQGVPLPPEAAQGPVLPSAIAAPDPGTEEEASSGPGGSIARPNALPPATPGASPNANAAAVTAPAPHSPHRQRNLILLNQLLQPMGPEMAHDTLIRLEAAPPERVPAMFIVASVSGKLLSRLEVQNFRVFARDRRTLEEFGFRPRAIEQILAAKTDQDLEAELHKYWRSRRKATAPARSLQLSPAPPLRAPRDANEVLQVDGRARSGGIPGVAAGGDMEIVDHFELLPDIMSHESWGGRDHYIQPPQEVAADTREKRPEYTADLERLTAAIGHRNQRLILHLTNSESAKLESDGAEAGKVEEARQEEVRRWMETNGEDADYLQRELHRLRQAAMDGYVPVNRLFAVYRILGKETTVAPPVEEELDKAGDSSAQDVPTQQRRLEALHAYIEKYQDTPLFNERVVNDMLRKQSTQLRRETLRKGQSNLSFAGRTLGRAYFTMAAGMDAIWGMGNAIFGNDEAVFNTMERRELFEAGQTSKAWETLRDYPDQFHPGRRSWSDIGYELAGIGLEALPELAAGFGTGLAGKVAFRGLLGNCLRLGIKGSVKQLAATSARFAGKGAEKEILAALKEEAKALGKNALKEGAVTKVVHAQALLRAESIGFKTAGWTSSFAQNAGDFVGRALDHFSPEDIRDRPDDVKRALYGALLLSGPATALDFMDGVEKKAVETAFARTAYAGTVHQIRQRLTQRVASFSKDLGLDIAKEMRTGLGQSLLGVVSQRWTSGRGLDEDLTDAEAREIIEGTITEGVVGGQMKIAGAALGRADVAWKTWQAGRDLRNARRQLDQARQAVAAAAATAPGTAPAPSSASSNEPSGEVTACQNMVDELTKKYDEAVAAGDRESALQIRKSQATAVRLFASALARQHGLTDVPAATPSPNNAPASPAAAPADPAQTPSAAPPTAPSPDASTVTPPAASADPAAPAQPADSAASPTDPSPAVAPSSPAETAAPGNPSTTTPTTGAADVTTTTAAPPASSASASPSSSPPSVSAPDNSRPDNQSLNRAAGIRHIELDDDGWRLVMDEGDDIPAGSLDAALDLRQSLIRSRGDSSSSSAAGVPGDTPAPSRTGDGNGLVTRPGENTSPDRDAAAGDSGRQALETVESHPDTNTEAATDAGMGTDTDTVTNTDPETAAASFDEARDAARRFLEDQFGPAQDPDSDTDANADADPNAEDDSDFSSAYDEYDDTDGLHFEEDGRAGLGYFNEPDYNEAKKQVVAKGMPLLDRLAGITYILGYKIQSGLRHPARLYDFITGELGSAFRLSRDAFNGLLSALGLRLPDLRIPLLSGRQHAMAGGPDVYGNDGDARDLHYDARSGANRQGDSSGGSGGPFSWEDYGDRKEREKEREKAARKARREGPPILDDAVLRRTAPAVNAAAARRFEPLGQYGHFSALFKLLHGVRVPEEWVERRRTGGPFTNRNWARPDNWKLPATDGEWLGAVGNSGWKSYDNDINQLTGGRPVHFRDGAIDLGPYTLLEYTFRGLDGGDNDFKRADRNLMQVLGLKSVRQARLWRGTIGLTWHHHQNGRTLQLVPSGLNNEVPHIGGAAIIGRLLTLAGETINKRRKRK